MGGDTMDVEQLAAYLRRDAREVGKLANRGRLPGHKVGGEWRFARAEINHWLESQIHGLPDRPPARLETGPRPCRRGAAPSKPSFAGLRCRAVGRFDQGVRS